ncbi:MAG: PEP-utilizing enzyme [Candidatus Woesearchaeota archaeon]
MIKENKETKLTKQTVFKQIKERWYGQGFNCTPLILIPYGDTFFNLVPSINVPAKHIIYDFKEEYGKMYYSLHDLEAMSRVILEKLKKDKDFMKKIEKDYQENNIKPLKLFADIRKLRFSKKGLSALSNEELIEKLNNVFSEAAKTVGQSHIIEPFSLTTDIMIRDMLSKYVPDKNKLNIYLSALTNPAEKSFINHREEDLYRVSKLKYETDEEKQLKEKAMEEHINKFFWVRNTYSGRGDITIETVKEEIKNLNYEEADYDEIRKNKQKLIQELRLDHELVYLLELCDFISLWQDKRKENIFRGIHAIETLLEELAIRLNIEHKLLRYISYRKEITMELFEGKIKIDGIRRDIKKELEIRRKGCIFYTTPDDELILVDRDDNNNDYAAFHKQMNEKDKNMAEREDLHGMCASIGVAVGRARICKKIESIRQFKQGEVLVASMTRPEFLPAMKKASAIVTDEGGLTCHAAIVSRELGIPCIIGTKTATTDFKDGDLLEVKANHGIVRMLKKCELNDDF